jgi:hypothetical protein
MNPNPYPVGSLLWVNFNMYLEVRRILDAVLNDEMSIEDAKINLYALDTDSVSS